MVLNRGNGSSETLWSCVEILRSLYHIDIIRRNFRTLQHKCNTGSIGPCTTCEVKDVFGRLTEYMRNPILNPQLLSSLMCKTHIVVKTAAVSNNGHQTLYNFILSLLPRELSLRAEYSLTKVCLTCHTYSHSENVEKYSHRIESVDSNLPSFEFGLKSSLDSTEFCDKVKITVHAEEDTLLFPDCFGSLRIFRVLKRIPNLLTLEFECMRTSQLPLTLKPCLIFESPSSQELTLSCLTLKNPPATLFFHTRLQQWILIDRSRIQPFQTFANIQSLNLSVDVAFYTKLSIASTSLNPPNEMRVTTIPPLAIPTPPIPETRIYENWPLDADDSGQGSEVTSSINESLPSSTTSSSSTEHSAGDNKYATIKRKKKKGVAPIPLSVSVPDLRHLIESSRKVSFDTQVTLVDDEAEEEYIPHPILQRVLAQLNLTSTVQQSQSSQKISLSSPLPQNNAHLPHSSPIIKFP